MATEKKAEHRHYGHRARLKRRFYEQGLDSLADHEVLELLLYFAIPYKDTNETAHELLAAFGSLANVLEAPPEALTQVNGIGENSAALLNLIPELAGRYLRDCWQPGCDLSHPEDVEKLAVSLFTGRQVETFYLICLDAKKRLKNAIKLAEGTIGEVAFYPADVVKVALSQKCRSVILAHNHPGGNLRPSRDDIDLTIDCCKALVTIDVKVLDHLVVSGEQTFSFRENDLMQHIMMQAKLKWSGPAARDDG